MKKALFSLLLVAAIMPFAMAQSTQRAIVTANIARCATYTWDVTGQTFTADTVVMYLNATNDTLYVLNLTINQPSNITTDVISNNCTYTWRGTTYNQSGTFTQTVYATSNEICDSVFTLNLSVASTETETFNVNTCGAYSWNGGSYTTSGTYTDTTVNDGCTHVEVLNLSIVSTINVSEEVSNCGTFNWYGEPYTASGVYTHHETDTVLGCDTLHTLTLTLVSDTAAMVYDSACASKTWRNQTFTESGVYYVANTNETNGCVTYYPITLNIKTPRTPVRDTAMTGCNSVLFSVSSLAGSTSKRFTENCTFDTMITDRRWARCYDSTIHLNVTIHKSGYDSTYANACDSFYWSLAKKVYYKTPETTPSYAFATDTFGCDSIMRLFLVVKKAPVISAINGEWHLNDGDTAILYPTCTDGATYKWTYGTNKTSTADTLKFKVEGNTDVALEATINYAAEGFACHDTSWITIVTFVGINEVSAANVTLYPNPCVGQLNIESAEAVREVVVFNTLGQQVAVKHNLGNQGVMNLSTLAKGTYTMRLTLENGQAVTRKFVITK